MLPKKVCATATVRIMEEHRASHAQFMSGDRVWRAEHVHRVPLALIHEVNNGSSPTM